MAGVRASGSDPTARAAAHEPMMRLCKDAHKLNPIRFPCFWHTGPRGVDARQAGCVVVYTSLGTAHVYKLRHGAREGLCVFRAVLHLLYMRSTSRKTHPCPASGSTKVQIGDRWGRVVQAQDRNRAKMVRRFALCSAGDCVGEAGVKHMSKRALWTVNLVKCTSLT